MNREETAERLIWGSRSIVIIAVFASMLVCIGMYFVATRDVFFLVRDISIYLGNGKNRNEIVTAIVEIIDGYLLATTLLLFAFGLYELFISPIDTAKDNKLASRLLCIQSIDDLKERLSKLILLILIVKFFEDALKWPDQVKSLDLLYFGIGVFLISGAISLGHKRKNEHEKHTAGRKEKEDEKEKEKEKEKESVLNRILFRGQAGNNSK